MVTALRGLNTFITDIRHCPNKEQEQKRCEQEMAKIRGKFASQKGLTGYHRKKYVWKLLYMYILGYDIDFGHEEASFLINSPKFSEKYTGYIATGILVSESNEDLYKTITNSIMADLNSQNEIHQSLALAMIGSMAAKELTFSLSKEVQKIAFSEGTRWALFVKKKAILCLLRMYRKFPDRFFVGEWGKPIIQMFEQKHFSLGYTSSACSMLLGVAHELNLSMMEEIVPRIVKILQRLVIHKDCSPDYQYYSTANPWLQVKLLKILQLFPIPGEKSDFGILMDCLTKIMKKTEITKMSNKNNADHGILFEASNLIIHYGKSAPLDLRNETITLMGIFITIREPNIRYLGLETLCKFHESSACEKILTEHLKVILHALKDNDISIRRRALDILYLMCSAKLAAKVVNEMLNYIKHADMIFKEELVLKIAILAEKFADDLEWYIDVVIQLIQVGGEFVTDDIWFRIIQIITGFGENSNATLQKYASLKIYQALQLPYVHENLVKIGSYVISEYPQYIVEQGKEPQKLFDTLFNHFGNCSEKAKSIMLTSFAKLANKYEDLIDSVQSVYLTQSEHFDPDLQQRSIEYQQLFMEDDNIRMEILSKMPTFSEEIQANSSVLKRIYNLKMGSKNVKDPTILQQHKKEAEKAVEEFKTATNQKNLNTSSQKSATIQFQTSSGDSYVKILKKNPCFDLCSDKIAVDGPNVINPEKLSFNSGEHSNFIDMKGLLLQPNGKLFEDNNLIISYKSEYQQHMGRVAMQFESKGGQLSNIQIMISNGDGMLFNISPVRYEGSPVVMIQVLSIEPSQQIPKASLFYQINSDQKKIQFSMPILTNKFCQPVDIPLNTIYKFYEEYSFSKNPNYFKIDSFLKNPAPPQVPLTEMMKKIGGMLQTGFNLKPIPIPDMNNIEEINATGQFYYKNEEGNIMNLPIVLQVQCFQQMKENIRISLRCAGSEGVISGIYQVLRTYLGQ